MWEPIPKIIPGYSESPPLETLNQEVNPDHLKGVQSRASRVEEREKLSGMQTDQAIHKHVY